MSDGVKLHAFARGTIAGAALTVVRQQGAVLARTGLGVYTLTLDTPCPEADSDLTVTVDLISAPAAAVNATFGVAHTDLVKTINVNNTAVPPAAIDPTGIAVKLNRLDPNPNA